ncbi:ORF6N domain-containing protein [Lysinibacillus sp. NPDC048646]
MNEVQVIVHKNQRVLTTGQLAEIYWTDSKRISNNFNEKKFVIGKV